jgi:hypothetical protein
MMAIRIMKVALFMGRDGRGHVFPANENVEKYCPQDVRITEYVEVSFPELLPQDQQVALERARLADIEYHRSQLADLLRRQPDPPLAA